MKKTKIVVTFDQHNLPVLKATNASRTQIMDASIFLNGVSREKKIKCKKPNKIAKFFRCLYAVTKEVRADRRCKEV